MDVKQEKAQPDVDLTAMPAVANDSRPVFERLRDYAERGMEAPETLSLAEIRQLSFALTLYLQAKS